METRFGLKDFFLFLLVGGLVVLVILAMFQYDRQWGELRSIRGAIETQDREIRRLQGLISNGVALAPVAGASTTQPVAAAIDPATDPFARLRAAQALPNYARGDWLIQMFPGQVARLTPLLSGDAYASEVESHILESLATRDPDTLEWRPHLATDWEVEDNVAAYQDYVEQQETAGKSAEEIAADPNLPVPVRVRFTLRDDVRFSDGTPLTVDDVVFTYDFIMDEEINAPRQRAYLSRIKDVRKVGEDGVEFVFAEPYFEAFELAAGFPVLPEHFYGAIPPEEFNQSVGYLLGSGPYKLEDPKGWKPGTGIQLVRNPAYWGVSPAFNRLVYREISNDKARQTAFRAGEADTFGASPEQYREMTRDAELMTRVQAFEYQNPVGGYRYVAWNQQNPLFKDKRVRQALTMLLDRQRMIDEMMLGYGVLATGPFNPIGKQYSPNVEPWPYDVKRAKALLAEAGFTDGDGDGVLDGPEGREFAFKLTYPAGSAAYDKIVLFMRDAFARAGIVMTLDPLEWAVFTERLENKNFEAISLGWTSGLETDIYQMFHSSQAEPGGDNFMSYRSTELDEVIDQARTTMDEAERMKLWNRAHEILHEDQPYTFLAFGKSLFFVDGRVHNVKRVQLGVTPESEWFVPLDLQKYTQP